MLIFQDEQTTLPSIMETDAKKAHRKRLSGPKAEKKRRKRDSSVAGNKSDGKEAGTACPIRRNPKAFAVHSAVRLQKEFHHAADVALRRERLPVVDRAPLVLPPVIVVLAGPPLVGKTTLLRGLVRNYTRHRLAELHGPITVVAGKQRRVTLIECKNDLGCMIDLAKVADLILLLVDAKYGLEMETFEFLNICQTHGMPRVMTVLTHLDLIRAGGHLKKARRIISRRLWGEGSRSVGKVFQLSGFLNGDYLYKDVHNLARFISVMNFHSPTLQLSSPHLLADRLEDLTDPEKVRQNPWCDRRLCLYGYLRGAPMRSNSQVHIPGVGDLSVASVGPLPDPCPAPGSASGGRRRLGESQRLLYAPFGGQGGLLYDRDAVYLDIGGSHSHAEPVPGSDLVSSLRASQTTLDSKIAAGHMTLFSESQHFAPGSFQDSEEEKKREAEFVVKGKDVNDLGRNEENENYDNLEVIGADETSSETEEAASETSEEPSIDRNAVDCKVEQEDRIQRKRIRKGNYKEVNENGNIVHNDIEEEDDFDWEQDRMGDEMEFEEAKDLTRETEGALNWKFGLAEKAAAVFSRAGASLQRRIYGEGCAKEVDDGVEELGGMFLLNRMKAEVKDHLDSTLLRRTEREWDQEDVRDSIKDCFVTGHWAPEEDASTLLAQDGNMYGDFEDLETGQVHSGKDSGMETSQSENKGEDLDLECEGQEEKNRGGVEVKKDRKTARLERKKMLKEAFNRAYDGGSASFLEELKAESERQTELNRSELSLLPHAVRTEVLGVEPGAYVRIEFSSVPLEFLTHFQPSYPIVVGGVVPGEGQLGFMQVKIKQHRWLRGALKCKDPVMVSLGWRRFQSLPVYHSEGHDGRKRMLKYTPPHTHCLAALWGPITAQSSGIVFLKSLSNEAHAFRIAATGVVLESDHSASIVKKLKLVGSPFKIFRKTTFIKGMFSSALEATRCEGVGVRTVSGIRGVIKRALRPPHPPGSVRATFEDRVQLSDLVFVRAWASVPLPQHCIPVPSLLLPEEDRASWQGVRLTSVLRKEHGLKTPHNPDSVYKPVVRKPRFFPPIQVPRSLQKSLPFSSKPKFMAPKQTTPRNLVRPAVIREPHERKVHQLLHALRTMRNERERKQKKEKTASAAKWAAEKGLKKSNKEVKEGARRYSGSTIKRGDGRVQRWSKERQ